MNSTVKSAFVNKVLGKMSSITNGEVTATRNYRKAVAAIKGQISALESAVVEAEEAIASAEEDLENTKYPTTAISEPLAYLRKLVAANDAVADRKQTLESVNKSLAFYTALLKEFTNTEE